MGNKTSKTRPSSRTDIPTNTSRPGSSPNSGISAPDVRASLAKVSWQQQKPPLPTKTAVVPVPSATRLPTKQAIAPVLLEDPDLTVSRNRLNGRYLSENEEGSNLGQDSTLRNAHGSGTVRWTPGHGLVGLRNMGNTCYMNSILQCICHCPGFSEEFLDTHQILQKTNPRSKLRGYLAESLSQLVKRMRAAADFQVITPSEIKGLISRLSPNFSGYTQQDAQEFLRLLLDGLNHDLNRVTARPVYKELSGFGDYTKVAEEWFSYCNKRDSSLVTDYFRGQLLTTIICSKCRAESIACDTFLDLSLPIPGNKTSVTLEDCFAAFTATSTVEGYKCEKCKKTSSSKMQMTLWRIPKLLVIHLKRFSSNSWRRSKVNTEVRLPRGRLDLSAFASQSTHPSCQEKYDLFAVSHHVGDLGRGHYFA